MKCCSVLLWPVLLGVSAYYHHGCLYCFFWYSGPFHNKALTSNRFIWFWESIPDDSALIPEITYFFLTSKSPLLKFLNHTLYYISPRACSGKLLQAFDEQFYSDGSKNWLLTAYQRTQNSTYLTMRCWMRLKMLGIEYRQNHKKNMVIIRGVFVIIYSMYVISNHAWADPLQGRSGLQRYLADKNKGWSLEA